MYVKFYATIEKFFDAKWDAMWKLKKAFNENDIEIPFNRDGCTHEINTQ